MMSVCLPYWDRQHALDGMFRNYDAVYPGLPIEFSVCDDGSPVSGKVPRGVTLTRMPVKTEALNPCAPINRAVNASTGEIIVLTNAEIRHTEPTLLMMRGLLEDDLDYVTATCTDPRRGLLAGEGVDYTKAGRLPVPPGAHFHFLAMFTRKLWEKAGGFDEAYRHGLGCDDNDWVWRCAAAGARFRLTPSTVEHTNEAEPIRWQIPHNRELFFRKWPLDRQMAVTRAMACV